MMGLSLRGSDFRRRYHQNWFPSKNLSFGPPPLYSFKRLFSALMFKGDLWYRELIFEKNALPAKCTPNDVKTILSGQVLDFF